MSQKKRNNVDLGKLFVANSVTLATRVRAYILRAIANKLNRKGEFELYVTPFSSRPVLHVNDIAGNKAPYALTFSDAVTRFGSKLEEEDLGEAYRRAGKSFDRQLSQIFVVLKEDPNNKRVIAARGTRGQYRGTGRGRGYGAPRGGNQERGRGNIRGFSNGQGRPKNNRGTKRRLEDQPPNERSGQWQPQQQNGSQLQPQFQAENTRSNPNSNVGYAVKRQNLNI